MLDRFNLYMLICVVNLQEGDTRNEVSQNYVTEFFPSSSTSFLSLCSMPWNYCYPGHTLKSESRNSKGLPSALYTCSSRKAWCQR